MAGAAIAAVLVAGGTHVAFGGSAAGGGYRTAVVQKRPVEALLHAVATIEPVSQASIGFPVSGTVSAVRVAVGDTVVTGQELAGLDLTSLQTALHEKQAALTRAELNLQRGLDGETSGPSGAGSGSSSGSGAPTGASALAGSAATSHVATAARSAVGEVGGSVPGTASGSTTASTTRPSPTSTTMPSTAPSLPSTTAGSASGTLGAAQQALLAAQHQASVALGDAQVAFDAATSVCAAVDEQGPSGTKFPDGATTPPSSPSTPSAPTTSTTSTAPTTAGGASDAAGITACRAALRSVLEAQGSVAASQRGVATASAAYTAVIEQQAAAAGSPTDAASGSSGRTAPTGSSPAATSSGASSPGGSTTRVPSAEDLVSYQKAVDAAEAQVVVAEQAIAQATIVSPISGTVAAVSLSVGDSVSAGSATATIVVVGQGGFEVSTSVSVADLPDVEVGQRATVTPDGGAGSVVGEVVRIGVAGTSSGSTTTYPVVIGLTGDTSRLGNGATASVSIVTDAATEALAVPTSAVSVDGSRHSVTVVKDGTATATSIDVGAVGATWTEVTKGLSVGDVVALADLSTPLPGSATDGSGADSGRTRFVVPGGFSGRDRGTGAGPTFSGPPN